MPEDLTDHLEIGYQTVSEVIKSFEWLEGYFFENDDLRGVFATAYLHITHAINKEIEAKSFLNNSWSRDYLIRFANLYREAILHYEKGNRDLVPKSWQIAFNTAKKHEGFIIQHLLLGINAHINHDLAIALFDVGIDPDRDQKYSDHTSINKILEKATDGLKQEVADKYAPILKRLDRGFGTIDDEITEFSIEKAREHAWSSSIALTIAQTASEQKIFRDALDEQAAVLAHLIMASPTREPLVVKTVGFLEWLDRIYTKIRSFFR